MAHSILGWDIGGVNIKAARVDNGRVAAAYMHPFILRERPRELVRALRSVARKIHPRPVSSHVVTMTAELSRIFRTKRDGVSAIVRAVDQAFPQSPIAVYGVGARFHSVRSAVAHPYTVAAANWSATAEALSTRYPDSILIDTGTTTTDIIPIVGGRVVAIGVTDPDRLATRELVYSGAVRTPTEALASLVAVRGGTAGTSADGFALSGDVHVWLGKLPPEDYTAPTPDGRLATRQSCGDRLARVVCGDRALLSDRDLTRIARSLAAAQVARLVEAIDTVRQRHPSVRLAVVAGLGEFVARSAARAAGLSVVPLSRQWGTAGSRAAAAVSVALLWDAKQHSVR